MVMGREEEEIMGSHRDVPPRALPPRGADLDRPNPARIYDYALGGRANFAADRAAFDAFAAVFPDNALVARSNRAFLRRVVTYLARQGIDQFLDIGSGLPTAGNVHEVARAVNPHARVVYVDSDPVAVRYSRQLLAEEQVAGVTAIEADLRDPAAILGHPRARALLDLARPVGLLLVAVLHFIPDDEARRAVRELTVAAPPGSYLTIAHGTLEGASEGYAQLVRLYEDTARPLHFRPHAAVEGFFAGFELVEPGLVYASAWRPEPDGADDPLRDEPGRAPNWAGVGRKL